MAGYRYRHSAYSSSCNAEAPPQLSTALSYDSKHHGRPLFVANEQDRPFTRYYGPKEDDMEIHATQRGNVIERVYSSKDGTYKYVEVTRTEPRTLITGSLEGTPAEVSELYTKLLNEVSEPLQELHLTDHYNDRYRGPFNLTQDYPKRVVYDYRHERPSSPTQDYLRRPEKLVNEGYSKDGTRPGDNCTGRSSASYWKQFRFNKQHKPIRRVTDYRNKPTKICEAEPTRILTGPGMARPAGTIWDAPKGRDTSLSTPTTDIDEAMSLLLAAARSSAPAGAAPDSYGYGGIRDHREAVRPSGVTYVIKESHSDGPVSSFSGSDGYGEPMYREEAARPSAYAAHSEIGQEESPVSPMPMQERLGEPINKREVAKPSKYASASEVGQYNPPVSTMPMKDNYGPPINKREAANSFPHATASGTGQQRSPVSTRANKDSYGESINKSEHAKPSSNATALTIGQSNHPLPTKPNNDNCEYSIDNNEHVKPSRHAVPSEIGQGNYTDSSMPKKDSYGKPITKSGAAKPSPYAVASNDPYCKSEAATSLAGSPINAPLSNKYGYTNSKDNREAAKPTTNATNSSPKPSKYMHVSSNPIETYPVNTARRYGSDDSIDSREAARLYGNTDAPIVYDDEDRPKITSKDAAKKYKGKFVF